MRRCLADTFAMVIFSTIVGVFVEVVVAGLALEQSARIRLAAIPVMLLAGRPYGMYRDWLFRLLGNKSPGQFKAAVLDTSANVTFQVPVYSWLLALNGATASQRLTAVVSIMLIIVCMSDHAVFSGSRDKAPGRSSYGNEPSAGLQES